MNISILVGTYGHTRWQHLAQQQAVPSALDQGAHEVLWQHDIDGTLASVRNKLAQRATGDWLCHVDADDRLGDGYLDAMETGWRDFEMAMTPTCPLLLVPAVQYVNEPPDLSADAPAIPAWGRPMIDVNCAVIGTLVPRALSLQVGGFRDRLVDGTLLTSLEDWDLWLRCMIAGAHLVPVPSAVYRARVNANGRNADQSSYRAIRAELEPSWRETTLQR